MKGLKCIEMIGKNELVKTFNQQEKDFPYVLDCIILKHTDTCSICKFPGTIKA